MTKPKYKLGDIVGVSKEHPYGFKVVGEETPSPAEIPEYLYHFTPRRNLDSILRSGLVPSRDEGGNKPYVWTTIEPYPIKDDKAVIKISTRGLDPRKFRVFEDHRDTFLYGGKIPAGNLKVVTQ